MTEHPDCGQRRTSGRRTSGRPRSGRPCSGRRLFAVLTVVALLGVLAGCSSGHKNSTSTASASRTIKQAAVIKVTTAPGTATGFVGARNDVTKVDCSSDGILAKASGTLTNTSGAPADYRIYTSFLSNDNDTRGLVETDVNGVGAGVTKGWSGQLPLTATDLHCVLRVERTPSK